MRDEQRLGTQVVVQEFVVRLPDRDGDAREVAARAARGTDQLLCPSVTLLLFLPDADHHDDARDRSASDELLLPRRCLLLVPSAARVPRLTLLHPRGVNFVGLVVFFSGGVFPASGWGERLREPRGGTRADCLSR